MGEAMALRRRAARRWEALSDSAARFTSERRTRTSASSLLLLLLPLAGAKEAEDGVEERHAERLVLGRLRVLRLDDGGRHDEERGEQRRHEERLTKATASIGQIR